MNVSPQGQQRSNVPFRTGTWRNGDFTRTRTKRVISYLALVILAILIVLPLIVEIHVQLLSWFLVLVAVAFALLWGGAFSLESRRERLRELRKSLNMLAENSSASEFERMAEVRFEFGGLCYATDAGVLILTDSTYLFEGERTTISGPLWRTRVQRQQDQLFIAFPGSIVRLQFQFDTPIDSRFNTFLARVRPFQTPTLTEVGPPVFRSQLAMWNLAMSIGIPALGVLVIGLFLYMIESMGQPVMSQEAPSMTKLALVFFIIGGGYLLWLTWALLRDYRDLKRAEILSVAQRAEGEPDALRIRSRRGSVVETEENELRA